MESPSLEAFERCVDAVLSDISKIFSNLNDSMKKAACGVRATLLIAGLARELLAVEA